MAFILTASLLYVNGRADQPAREVEVVVGAPAERAGFAVGDVLLAVNGHAIRDQADVGFRISRAEGKTLSVLVRRGDVQHLLTVTPERVETTDRWGARHSRGRIGIRGPEPEWHAVPLAEALPEAADHLLRMSRRVLAVLSSIVTEARTKDLAGPGQMTMAAGDAFATSPATAIAFAALVSLNLAVFNLLPLPGLDGWHVLAGIAGGLTRRELGARAQKVVTLVGAAAVLLLMLLGLLNDVLLFL